VAILLSWLNAPLRLAVIWEGVMSEINEDDGRTLEERMSSDSDEDLGCPTGLPICSFISGSAF